LVNEFVKDPLLITKVDESVGVRFTGAVAPYLALKHNHLLPMGIGHYQEFLQKLYSHGLYRNFLSPFVIKEKDRLGGSANMIIFQLGILGLLFPIAIILAFKYKLSVNDKQLFALLLFLVLLFTQIQLMHSMIGFIIATALYFTRSNSIPSAAK
jgi:hypothetical protein